MKITVVIEVTRSDGVCLNKDQRQDILGQVEAYLPDMNLDEITINEGKANEEAVDLEVAVVEIGETKR